MCIHIYTYIYTHRHNNIYIYIHYNTIIITIILIIVVIILIIYIYEDGSMASDHHPVHQVSLEFTCERSEVNLPWSARKSGEALRPLHGRG